MIDERFALDRREIESPLWRRLSSHLEQRLDLLRKRNDSTDQSEADTAKLRGQIAEVKAMLALAQPKVTLE